MNLYPIIAGNFMLDGGAMFGVVPRSIWAKTNPADHKNLIQMAARCLLVEDGNRLVLIDAGMGDKQSDKFFSYYCQWGEDTLASSLKKQGFHPDDITDVFLTHLHFDHCGGGVCWDNKKTFYKTTFKNAKYWSNKDHWAWASSPNKREGASFLKENISPILESGQLNFIEKDEAVAFSSTPLGFEVLFVDGHTEKQMIPIIKYKDVQIAFAADLVPTHGHVPLPYIMGYDVRPLVTLKEKEWFLDYACKNNMYLFFEHDPFVEIGSLKQTDRGVRLDSKLKLNEIL
ncbi:MAG TPA: MBL fold metallo-hydrolase [Flavobacteriales bacterium]|nr:MBL fold metallo-hydrolase [Flavobacteriales bacterium]